MGAEVGLSGTSTGTLRTGLTTALAAVQAGAERANVAMRNSPKAVEVDWGEAEAAGLSAARPGQEQNPAGDAIMYSQTAWVDRVQVRIETEPGARSLIETDIAGWVTAAKDAGFTDVRLRASDSGIWRSFRVSDARSSSDVEAVAPPLLAAIDRCDVSTGTELSTGQQYGNDAARLEYDCRDGWLAVAEESADENTRETTDPEAAQRALDAGLRRTGPHRRRAARPRPWALRLPPAGLSAVARGTRQRRAERERRSCPHGGARGTPETSRDSFGRGRDQICHKGAARRNQRRKKARNINDSLCALRRDPGLCGRFGHFLRSRPS